MSRRRLWIQLATLLGGVYVSGYVLLRLARPVTMYELGALTAVTAAPAVWHRIRSEPDFDYGAFRRETGTTGSYARLAALFLAHGVATALGFFAFVAVFGQLDVTPLFVLYGVAWAAGPIVATQVFWALHADYWTGDTPSVGETVTVGHLARTASSWLPFAVFVSYVYLVGVPSYLVVGLFFPASTVPMAYFRLRDATGFAYERFADDRGVPRVLGWLTAGYVGQAAIATAVAWVVLVEIDAPDTLFTWGALTVLALFPAYVIPSAIARLNDDYRTTT